MAEVERLNAGWQKANADNLALGLRLTATRAAGEKLAGFAGHDDGCKVMVVGIWSDPVECTCGYSEALPEWKALTDE